MQTRHTTRWPDASRSLQLRDLAPEEYAYYLIEVSVLALSIRWARARLRLRRAS